MASNRSRTPPCPGSSVPRSLTPRSRLIIDSHRSPIGARIATTRPRARPCATFSFHGASVVPTIPPITMAATIPPNSPSQVLFGDRRGDMRLRPNCDPMKYPNTSYPIAHAARPMISPVPSGALSRRPANAPKMPMYPNPNSVIDVDDRACLHHLEHVPEHRERDDQDRHERE